jgi:hypothetical protein
MGDEQDTDPGYQIGLAEMIETLRSELEAAQIQGAARPVAFGIEKVDLELKVAVSRKLKTGGGIKFWVVSAEGGAEGGSETVHNFKLTLSPLDPVTKARLEVAGNTETAINRNK